MRQGRCFGAARAGVSLQTWLGCVGELWRRNQSLRATIVLVGCEHSLQPTASLGIGEAEIERGQKHHFSRMLEGLIGRHSIHLIGEETRASEENYRSKTSRHPRMRIRQHQCSQARQARAGNPGRLSQAERTLPVAADRLLASASRTLHVRKAEAAPRPVAQRARHLRLEPPGPAGRPSPGRGSEPAAL